MQPVPEAAYRSDFRENTNFCPQRDSNLGPLAQQASVLSLDHCDHMFCMSRFTWKEQKLGVYNIQYSICIGWLIFMQFAASVLQVHF